MWQILIGILLLLHGLISMMFMFYVKVPDKEEYFGWSRKSWILDRFLKENVVKILGFILWSIVIAGFIVSGIVIFTQHESWRLITIIVSFISLLPYGLFWKDLYPEKKYFILGPIVAVGIIIALLAFNWPTDLMIFT